MNAASRVKAGWQFWSISGISLLWNAFGCVDYTMTELRNPDYLKNFPPEMMTVIDAMPAWATAMWAIGVWSSLLGSILLLMRSRHAVAAFMVSLVTALVSFAYQHSVALPPSLDTGSNWVMTVVILGAILFLWWYARRSRDAGILR